jgi:hypothetical protein
MKHASENSLEGLRHCLDAGAAAAECDVTFIDDTPFIWGSWMKDQEPILRVRDVLNFVALNPGMKVYFDVKYYGGDSDGFIRGLIDHVSGHFIKVSDRFIWLVRDNIVQPAIERGVADRIGFVTFCGGARLLYSAKLLDPRIETDLIVILPWTRPGRYQGYVDAISIGWKAFNHWKLFPWALRAILAQARSKKIQIRGGIVNTVEEINWLLKHEADALWTDDIPLARAYLACTQNQEASVCSGPR